MTTYNDLGFSVTIASTGVPQQLSAEALYAAYVTVQNNGSHAMAAAKNPTPAVGTSGIQISPTGAYTWPALTARGHLLNQIWIVGTAGDVAWVDGERF
jgi:hypothetical protein